MLLRDFVNLKMATADKTVDAEGVPLTMNNCKKYKKMRDLKVYGNCFQDGIPTPENPIEVQSVGELVTDESDINYGKYKVPIICRGINYFSMVENGFAPITINGITFTPLDDERIHITGKRENVTQNATLCFDFKKNIPLKAGEYWTTLQNNEYSWNGLDMLFRSTVGTINAIHTKTEITADGNVYGFHISVNTSDGQREWDDIIDIQLEKYIDKKHPYEPYVEPITTNIFLDEPLRDVDRHNYKDYIDFKNKKLHRLIHEYYLDGSQAMTPYNDILCFVVTDTRCIYAPNATGVSSHFKNNDYTNQNEPGIGMANANGNRVQITHKKLIDGVTDTETLKQWLTKNPVTYMQPLETPIVEDLDIELPKLNAKTTIIEVDTSLAPSNISGKYILR